MIGFNNLGNMGRLGNQMFEYATLRGIAANKKYDWCIPPFNIKGIENYSLDRAFTLPSITATPLYGSLLIKRLPSKSAQSTIGES